MIRSSSDFSILRDHHTMAVVLEFLRANSFADRSAMMEKNRQLLDHYANRFMDLVHLQHLEKRADGIWQVTMSEKVE